MWSNRCSASYVSQWQISNRLTKWYLWIWGSRICSIGKSLHSELFHIFNLDYLEITMEGLIYMNHLHWSAFGLVTNHLIAPVNEKWCTFSGLSRACIYKTEWNADNKQRRQRRIYHMEVYVNMHRDAPCVESIYVHFSKNRMIKMNI